MDHLLYGGESSPPPEEWVDFVLQQSVYPGLHPDDIAELPAKKVETDLLMYQLMQANQGKK